MLILTKVIDKNITDDNFNYEACIYNMVCKVPLKTRVEG